MAEMLFPSTLYKPVYYPRYVSHTVLTRVVVSAWPGHASPVRNPGRICSHSTPPKDPVGPVRLRC